ncbi:MAG: hypothetical protein ACK5NT_13625 [Pyrinomonadaceae bacterium]
MSSTEPDGTACHLNSDEGTDADGNPIYNGTMKNGKCVSNAGSPVYIYISFPSFIGSSGYSPSPIGGYDERLYDFSGGVGVVTGRPKTPDKCESGRWVAATGTSAAGNATNIPRTGNQIPKTQPVNPNSSTWIDDAGNVRSKNFYGNQYVRSQKLTIASQNAGAEVGSSFTSLNNSSSNFTTKTIKIAGRTMFFTGALITGAQYQNGDISGGKAVLDLSMSAVGTFGGPYGAAVGATYFICDSNPHLGDEYRRTDGRSSGSSSNPGRVMMTNRLGRPSN